MTILEGSTTSENLENFLSTLSLQNLSDEELCKVREILNSKLSEVDCISRCRKHHKLHFNPESKKTN